MKLDEKLTTALNENRLLILGTQVLFGFQFNGIFQDQFEQLRPLARTLEWTFFAGWALLPLSVALAFDMYVAMGQMIRTTGSIVSAALFLVVALTFWYALAFVLKKRKINMPKKQSGEGTLLSTQVDQLLTEALLIIPGAQALLGFQLTVTLTEAFSELPAVSKTAHAAALCCLGLSVLLLMAPASLHRIAFDGEDGPQFVKIGSWFVISAPLPLALAIALDTYVAAGRALQSPAAAIALAIAAIAVLLGCWYVYPAWHRLIRR